MSSRNVAPIRYFPSCTENLLCQRCDRKCTKTRYESQPFCVNHIAGDTNLQKCNYVSSKTNRRCNNLIAKCESGKDGFCLDHARLVTQVRRGAAHRGRYRETCETIVQSFSQYSKFSTQQDSIPKPEPPPHKLSPNRPARPAIDYYSESSDEEESYISLGDTPLSTDDADVIMQSGDDPLKYAQIYTTEEIALITRDKFIKLQNLYLQYFKIIKQKLKNRAAYYKPKIAEELEKYSGVVFDNNDDYKEQKKVLQLRALKHYHKRRGVVALLRDASIQRRKEHLATSSNQPQVRLCNALDGTNTICGQVALPECPYCTKHVLNEPKQILFSECVHDACAVTVYQDAHYPYCHLHAPVPDLREKLNCMGDSGSNSRVESQEADDNSIDSVDVLPKTEEGLSRDASDESLPQEHHYSF